MAPRRSQRLSNAGDGEDDKPDIPLPAPKRRKVKTEVATEPPAKVEPDLALEPTDELPVKNGTESIAQPTEALDPSSSGAPDTSFSDAFLPSYTASMPGPSSQAYVAPTSSAPAAVGRLSKAEEKAAKAAEKARIKAEQDAVKAEAKRIREEAKQAKDEQRRVKAAATEAKKAAKALRAARIARYGQYAPKAAAERSELHCGGGKLMVVERVMTQRMFMVEREVLTVPGGGSEEKFAVVG
jgi:hypothetical protein